MILNNKNKKTPLQVDEIKIDKSFVDQLESNSMTISMLESIRHMADKFDLGFYYSKPNDITLTS